jgi:hypothetical protein
VDDNLSFDCDLVRARTTAVTDLHTMVRAKSWCDLRPELFREIRREVEFFGRSSMNCDQSPSRLYMGFHVAGDTIPGAQ